MPTKQEKIYEECPICKKPIHIDDFGSVEGKPEEKPKFYHTACIASLRQANSDWVKELSKSIKEKKISDEQIEYNEENDLHSEQYYEDGFNEALNEVLSLPALREEKE